MTTRTKTWIWLLGFLTLAGAAGAAETWTRVSTPNFTILTANSLREAREWAVALEATCREMKQITGVDASSLEPLTLVVFHDAASFNRVMQQSNVMTGNYIRKMTFCSFAHNGRAFTAVSPVDSDASRRSAFLASTLWLTTGSFHWPVPFWLTAGFQEQYAGYEIRDGKVIVGRLVEQGLLTNLSASSLGELLAARQYSSTYDMGDDNRFNCESWALVHFMMLGRNGENRPQFLRYLGDLQAGVDSDEAFAKAFPEGRAALGKRFERYVHESKFRRVILASDAAELDRGLAVRPATELEVQLAFSYMVLAGQGEKAAEPYIERVIRLAPTAPETLELQADVALNRGDDAKANEYFAQAVAAGSTFHLAHFYPLVDKAASMLGGEAASDRYDAAVARTTVDELKKTIRLRPNFLPAYVTFAGLIGSLAEVNADDGAVLAEGLRRYPTKAMIHAGQAAYDLKTGRFVSAKKRIDRIAKGEFEADEFATGYRHKLDLRLQALVNLSWMEKYYGQGKYDDAAHLLEKLDRAPLLPAELERKRTVAQSLAVWETMSLVKGAIARQDWDATATLLATAATQEQSEPAKAELAKLEAQVAAEKKAAGQ